LLKVYSLKVKGNISLIYVLLLDKRVDRSYIVSIDKYYVYRDRLIVSV